MIQVNHQQKRKISMNYVDIYCLLTVHSIIKKKIGLLKNSLKRFCQDLKKQAKSITDFLKKDHCHYTGKYRGAAHKIWNLMYNTPREIPVVFHNGSSYDYHFIIKGLAEKSEGHFECLGENKEKYITFSVPIKKKSNEDDTIIYRIKFIDSFRFMSTSLSTLVDNLSNKIIENGKSKNCDCCLDYIKIRKSGELIFECFNCKRRYLKNIDDIELKKIKKTLKILIIFAIKTLISLCFY